MAAASPDDILGAVPDAGSDTLCATALGTSKLLRRQRDSKSTQPDRE